MLDAALAYPRAGEGASKRIAFGGILVLFGFLIVPVILLQGYYLRVLDSSFRGEATPPSFGDWPTMFADGAKAIAVLFAYTLVPSMVLFVAALVGSDGGGGHPVLGTLFLLLSILLYAGVTYLAPIGLVTLARTGSMGATLERSEIVPIARSREYLSGWLLAMVVLIVGSIVAGMASVLLLGVFVFFYANVAAFYLAGQAISKAYVKGSVSNVPAPE